MIEVFEGFGLGAGKSYYVVTRLIKHFKQGGTAVVVDSMEILWENLKEYVKKSSGYILQDCQFQTLSEEKILALFEHTPPGDDEIPVVIVLDECHNKLNARDWNDKSKRALFDWCTQSRHDNNDIWFISQSAHNIDKQIRRLATFIWRVRNTANWGGNIITHFLKLVKFMTAGWHTGAYFIVTQLDQDGKTVVGRKQWLDQDPDVFKCYRSKSMQGRRKRSGMAIKRIQLERHKGRIPWLRWAVAGLIVSLGVVGCSRVFHTGTKEKPKAAEVTIQHVESKEKPKGPFDVRVELFRNQMGASVLTTDKWIYEKGKLSPDGMVSEIVNGQAKIVQNDGRILYVIGDRHNSGSVDGPVGRGRSDLAEAPAKREPLVIQDHGLFGPKTSPFPRETVSYDKDGAVASAPTPTATIYGSGHK